MRPRSANEWRAFWHREGDQKLEGVLREVWPPLREASHEAATTQAERVALLLSSAAPVRALAAELGRIRGELDAEPDGEADAAAAEAVHAWFQAQTTA